MTPVLFKCPDTGQMVQHHWEEDDPAGDKNYRAVECLACARVHFVNKAGQLLRDK
jgi:hypothetical protein